MFRLCSIVPMGARRIKALGEFAWINADIGVECLRCGLVRVYCAFEAVERFRERRWSPGIDEAVKRFRCSCGSREVRFRAVSITKRPKPIPRRPAALRPIYSEDARALSRRGASNGPDAAALSAAMDVLVAAGDARPLPPPTDPALLAAIEVLRPHVYDHRPIGDLLTALADDANTLYRGSSVRHAMGMILRQLGRFD